MEVHTQKQVCWDQGVKALRDEAGEGADLGYKRDVCGSGFSQKHLTLRKTAKLYLKSC